MTEAQYDLAYNIGLRAAKGESLDSIDQGRDASSLARSQKSSTRQCRFAMKLTSIPGQ